MNKENTLNVIYILNFIARTKKILFFVFKNIYVFRNYKTIYYLFFIFIIKWISRINSIIKKKRGIYWKEFRNNLVNIYLEKIYQ